MSEKDLLERVLSLFLRVDGDLIWPWDVESLSDLDPELVEQIVAYAEKQGICMDWNR